MKLDVYWMVDNSSFSLTYYIDVFFPYSIMMLYMYMHIYYYKTLLHNKSNCLRSLAMYTRSAGKFNGCWVEKCCDAVWLCSRMIGAVATWQFSLPFAHRAPAPILPCTPFSVSHFPRLRLSLTGWLCDAKFGLCMWPAPATGKPQSNFQPRAPFATQPAIFQLLCAPHRTAPRVWWKAEPFRCCSTCDDNESFTRK